MKKLIFGMLCILGGVWGPSYNVRELSGKVIINLDGNANGQPLTHKELYTEVQTALPDYVENSPIPLEIQFLVGNDELNERNASRLLSSDGYIEITCIKRYNKIVLPLSATNSGIIVHFQVGLTQKLRDLIEPCLQSDLYFLSRFADRERLNTILTNATSIKLTNGDNQLTLTVNTRYKRCSPWHALSRIDKNLSGLSLSQITGEHVLGMLTHQTDSTNYYWTIEGSNS